MPVFAFVWCKKVPSLAPSSPTFVALGGRWTRTRGSPWGAGSPAAAAASCQRKTVSQDGKACVCEQLVSLCAVALP